MRSTPLLLVACLAALMAGAQAIAVCDSGRDYWYQPSKDGQSFGDKNADIMYARIMGRYASSRGCKLLKSVKSDGCYNSIRAIGGRQMKGEYGFVARLQLACPGKAVQWQDVALTATAWRNGSFRITWTWTPPATQQQQQQAQPVQA